MAANDRQDWENRTFEASRAFTPRSPIDEKSLFAGREEQRRQIVDVINQKGEHAILFGERGVGKTSLANVLGELLGRPGSITAPRINCDYGDTFESIWRKGFDEVELVRSIQPIGFNPTITDKSYSAAELLGDEVSPDSVRRALTRLATGVLPIFIIDEFDRLRQEPRRAFADTIKNLSDHAVNATVIIVGVADSVGQLIEEHQSVERALRQIQMPRMSAEEIDQIITNGLDRLQMTIDGDALTRISKLAQGMPHYAHLLGLNASRVALDSRQNHVTTVTVERAIDTALLGTYQSVREDYDRAVRSNRKENLFGDVLLSCAITKKNELGFFAAQDVRGRLRAITGKEYEIPSFAQHLNEFSDPKGRNVLQKAGSTRRFRYRFLSPLLQPFIIMQGLKNHRVTMDMID